jgi:ferredoxin
MKVRVNVAACVGHARCAAVAPEVYDLDDNGFNVTAEKEVDESLRSQAIRGMRACPERIIWVEGVSDKE